MFCRIAALVLLIAILLPRNATAADGTLKISFKYDGTAQKPKAVAGVPGFCGPGGVTDESLVVGPNGGVQNIVMFMYTTTTSKAPDNPAASKRSPRK